MGFENLSKQALEATVKNTDDGVMETKEKIQTAQI